MNRFCKYFLLIMLLPVIVVISGCSSKSEDEPLILQVESDIRKVVADPERADEIIDAVNDLASEVTLRQPRYASLDRKWRELNRSRDASQEEYMAYFAEVTEFQKSMRVFILDIEFRIRSIVTEKEWKKLPTHKIDSLILEVREGGS